MGKRKTSKEEGDQLSVTVRAEEWKDLSL